MAQFRTRLLFPIAWSLLAAACQLQATPLPPAATPSEMTTQATPAAMEPTAPMLDESGLTGVVIAASDVASQPDTPLADQVVVAVGAEAASALLGLPAGDWDAQVLRFLHTTVAASANGIFTTQTDSSGRYRLLLEPGVYALCLADAAADGTLLEVRGCGRIEVAPATLQTVNVSSGFGEILLE